MNPRAIVGLIGLIAVARPCISRAQQCERPNMMIALDRSGSMYGTKWTQAKGAVDFILSNFGDKLRFGLDLFPSDYNCAAGNPNVDVGENTAGTIRSAMNGAPPNNGNTPTAATLMVLNQYRSLKDVSRRNFVVLVTDGCDTCANDYRGDPVQAVADLYANGIRTYVIGFDVSSWGDCNNWEQVLEDAAAAGNTGSYYLANDQSGLEDAMGAIVNASLQEICDNRDNDCDGLTDENWTDKGRLCRVTQGPHCYAEGTYVCDDTQDDVVCNAHVQTSPEVCDGRDNDCNGLIDDGFSDLDGDGYSQCSDCCDTGNETKAVGCSGAARGSIHPGAIDICNGRDDDCDGAVDEDDPQVGEACGATDVGECEFGTRLCVNNRLECVGGIGGSAEVCDRRDNDCDGQTDEHPVSEICNDGIDNDCDGLVDAWDPDCGTGCPPGKQEQCGISQGVCEAGVRTCQPSGAWGACVGAVEPSPEICDGRDNDCDGLTDEDAVREVCDDGVDNDCDGWVDLQDPDCGECTPGETRACGGSVGACRPGVQVCSAQARWSACGGEIGPEPESCDGLDNDCDEIVDEGNLCEGYDVCLCGDCASACSEGECPAGITKCVFDRCVSNPCCGVRCAPGLECNGNGLCVDPCQVNQVSCDPEQVCRMGLCVQPDCFAMGHECQEDQRCVGGACEPDPCSQIECVEPEYCREGICVAVACGYCRRDQICKAGECQHSNCADLACEAGRICVNGECAADPCQGVYCSLGATCESGTCVADPCVNIHCPGKSVCRDGFCVSTEPTTPDGGNDSETPGPADGESTTDRRDDGPGPSGGSCGCLTNTPEPRGSTEVWLILLAAILIWRRKRG